MIKKMISPQMLMKANSIIDDVSGNVETNMSQEQIQSLIKTQLSKGGAGIFIQSQRREPEEKISVIRQLAQVRSMLHIRMRHRLQTLRI